MVSERNAGFGPRAALQHTARSDPWVRAILVAFTATAALYLLPVLSSDLKALLSRAAGPFVFLCLVVGALTSGLSRLGTGERRFWYDVIAAFGALLAVSTLFLLFPDFERPLAVNLAIEALYAAYYAALALAAEGQPDRFHRRRPARLERALAWPAVITFILALFGYFSIIPILAGGGAPAGWVSSFALYLTLDAYLTIRFLALSRAAGSRRWGTLYLLLGLTTGAVFLTDLLELAVYAGAPARWGAALDLVYYAPYLLVALTRSRHCRFLETGPPPADERPEAHFTRLSGRTTIHALALPLLHLGGYGAGVFAAAYEPARDLLVFWAVLVLGSIAAVQHRVLQKKARELWCDREEVEADLRRNEKDLRMMVERYHADRKLRLTEEKFAKAFRVSPDGMLITSMVDGRIKDVNDSFELLTGFCREDIMGKSVVELGIWADLEDRDAMLQALQRDGSVRDRETLFRTRSGADLIGLLSVAELDVEGEPHLLSVTRDITERKRVEEKLKTQAVLLDKAQDAIAVLDLDDRVTYWNRSAERLYGWTASEALGRSAADLLYGETSQPALDALKKVDEQGDWIGELRQVTKDGQEIVVESWWTLVRDSDGKPRSKLVVSSEVTGRKAALEPLPA